MEKRGAQNTVKVGILSDISEYKAYLEALRKRETLRELNGGDTVEGLQAVRDSVRDLDACAKKKYARERSN